MRRVHYSQAALGGFQTDLSLELLHPSVPRLFDGAQHLRLSLLQNFEQTLKMLVGLPLSQLAIFLSER